MIGQLELFHVECLTCGEDDPAYFTPECKYRLGVAQQQELG